MGDRRRPLLPEIFRQNDLLRQKTATFEVLRANFARSTSAVTPAKKVQLPLLGSSLSYPMSLRRISCTWYDDVVIAAINSVTL